MERVDSNPLPEDSEIAQNLNKLVNMTSISEEMLEEVRANTFLLKIHLKHVLFQVILDRTPTKLRESSSLEPNSGPSKTPRDKIKAKLSNIKLKRTSESEKNPEDKNFGSKG